MKTVNHPLTGKAIPECLTGVIVPVYTPAQEDGSIDMKGLRAVVKHFGDSPYITSCFFRGGMGRMYTYSVDETKACIDLVMETLGGKKPVFFGTFGEFFDGHHAIAAGTGTRPDPKVYLQQSIELTQHAEKAGATGGVLVVPAALAADDYDSLQDVIFDYYRAVRESSDLPLMLYNTGGLPEEHFTTPDMVRRVCELGGFIGMKLSSNDMRWMTQLVLACEDSPFAMVSGAETSYYHTLCTGGLGSIGQGCNVNPEILQTVYKRFMAGDIKGALQAHYDVERILDLFEGTDASLAGLAYLKAKGVDVQLNARDGKTDAPSSEQIQAIVKGVDEFCEPYRQS